MVGIGHGRTLLPDEEEEEASGKLPSVGKKPLPLPLPPPLELPEPPPELPPLLLPPSEPEPVLTPESAKPERPDCVPHAYETSAVAARAAARPYAVRRFMAGKSDR
jgi:hypothetical protein